MSETTVQAQPSPRLLSPDETVMLLIDHQPETAFAVRSISTVELINNVTGLAKAATVFGIPVVLTTVAAKTVAGPVFPTVQAVFPDLEPIDRSTTNAWEDQRVVDAIVKTGRKKLVIAALWTEVCLTSASLSAVNQGYEVYIVTDASGGVSPESHERAVDRMMLAGIQPMTWLQVLVELQRDWARKATYNAVVSLAKEHGGAYGLALLYAKIMVTPKETTTAS